MQMGRPAHVISLRAFSAIIETCVQPREEGIGTGDTLDDLDSEQTEEDERGSQFDKNAETSELEKRDFDDVKGAEADVE
jgi:hypothetical protein